MYMIYIYNGQDSTILKGGTDYDRAYTMVTAIRKRLEKDYYNPIVEIVEPEPYKYFKELCKGATDGTD